MDPLSAASLGLGAVSLAFQVFSGCIKGYVVLCDAAGMPLEYQHLQTRLKMQKENLLAWSQVAGLANEAGPTLTTNLRLNRQLLLDILSEIKYLLDRFREQNCRYGDLNPVQEVDKIRAAEQEQVAAGTAVGKASGQVTKQRRFGLKSLHRAEEIALRAIDNAPSAPTRLRWAIFDHNEFEKLLDRLGELNTFMKSLMDESQGRELLRTQKVTLMSTLQLHNSIAEVKQLISALAIARTPDNRVSQTAAVDQASRSLGETQKDDESNILALAEFKRLNLDLNNLSSDFTNTALDLQHILLEDPIGDQTAKDGRVEAIYRGNGVDEHVWIEWKDYDLKPSAEDFAPDERILARVQRLAALLGSEKPENFRAPKCLGYFDDDQSGYNRFGFVFAKPAGVDPATPPTSLLELMKTAKPSLTDRTTLAKKIASCLFYLHSVNWLHKGLRSHNIVFFPDSAGQVDYSMPYLSGFDYARPAKDDELTEKPPPNPEYDVYRHPSAVGRGPEEPDSANPFKKTYDIYSLGVILVELANWSPIDKIVGIVDAKTAAPKITHGIRERLLSEAKFLGDIRADVGDVFRDVSEKCLQGAEGFDIPVDVDETDSAIGTRLQEAFVENVVEKLESMRI